jgi:hypothetical protein
MCCVVTGYLNDMESYPLATACNVHVTANCRDGEDFFLSSILTLVVKISQLSRNQYEIFFLLSALQVTDLTCKSLNIRMTCMISGFPYFIGEIFALVGCYTAYVCSLPTFWGNLSVPSSAVPKLC